MLEYFSLYDPITIENVTPAQRRELKCTRANCFIAGFDISPDTEGGYSRIKLEESTYELHLNSIPNMSSFCPVTLTQKYKLDCPSGSSPKGEKISSSPKGDEKADTEENKEESEEAKKSAAAKKIHRTMSQRTMSLSELTYYFAITPMMIFQSFEAETEDGRVLTGVVKERQRAQKEYTAAKEAGMTVEFIFCFLQYMFLDSNSIVVTRCFYQYRNGNT